MDGQTDRQTDTTELIVAFRSLTKAPKHGSSILVGNAVQVGVQTNETCYCKPLDVRSTGFQRQIRARGEHAGIPTGYLLRVAP